MTVEIIPSYVEFAAEEPLNAYYLGVVTDIWCEDAIGDFCNALPFSLDNTAFGIKGALTTSSTEVLIGGTPFSCYPLASQIKIANSIASYTDLAPEIAHKRFEDWYLKNIEQGEHTMETLRYSAKDRLYRLMADFDPDCLVNLGTWKRIHDGLNAYFMHQTDERTIDPLCVLFFSSYRIAIVEEFLSTAVIDQSVFRQPLYATD